MQLGMIGLGRMGANMVQRLINGGHKCVVFDLNQENVNKLVEKGATGSNSLENFVQNLCKPRSVWLMVPAGAATEKTVQELASLLEPGDIIIDGGNSMYKDDVRRAQELLENGIHYVDVGTSGGIAGIERGYCLMYGGEKEIVDRLEPVFKTLAPGKGNIERSPGRENKESTAEKGYLHCGPVGSGH
jgi:6-phosphogluconate dehydrogenase (decarboxylating) (EC 1.1.1.44)